MQQRYNAIIIGFGKGGKTLKRPPIIGAPSPARTK